MRPMPHVSEQQMRELHEKGFLTDAGLKTWKVCRRFVELKAQGKSSGEAITTLMEEFNLSDKRIESMVYGRGT